MGTKAKSKKKLSGFLEQINSIKEAEAKKNKTNSPDAIARKNAITDAEDSYNIFEHQIEDVAEDSNKNDYDDIDKKIQEASGKLIKIFPNAQVETQSQTNQSESRDMSSNRKQGLIQTVQQRIDGMNAAINRVEENYTRAVSLANKLPQNAKDSDQANIFKEARLTIDSAKSDLKTSSVALMNFLHDGDAQDDTALSEFNSTFQSINERLNSIKGLEDLTRALEGLAAEQNDATPEVAANPVDTDANDSPEEPVQNTINVDDTVAAAAKLKTLKRESAAAITPPQALTDGQHAQLEKLQIAISSWKVNHDNTELLNTLTPLVIGGSKKISHTPPHHLEAALNDLRNNLITGGEIDKAIKRVNPVISQYALDEQQRSQVNELSTALHALNTNNDAAAWDLTHVREAIANLGRLPETHALKQHITLLSEAITDISNPETLKPEVLKAIKQIDGHTPPTVTPMQADTSLLTDMQRNNLRHLQRLFIEKLGYIPGEPRTPSISENQLREIKNTLMPLRYQIGERVNPTGIQHGHPLYETIQQLAVASEAGQEAGIKVAIKALNDQVINVLPNIPPARLNIVSQDDLFKKFDALTQSMDNVWLTITTDARLTANLQAVADDIHSLLTSSSLREEHRLQKPLRELLTKLYPSDDDLTIFLNPNANAAPAVTLPVDKTDLKAAFTEAKEACEELNKNYMDSIKYANLKKYQEMAEKYKAESIRRSGSISIQEEGFLDQITRKCQKMMDTLDLSEAKLREELRNKEKIYNNDDLEAINDKLERIRLCREDLSKAIWNKPESDKFERVNCFSTEHVVLIAPTEVQIQHQVNAFFGNSGIPQGGGNIATDTGIAKSSRFEGGVRINHTTLQTVDNTNQVMNTQVVSVQGVDNGKYQSKLYYNRGDIQNMPMDQLRKMAVIEFENFSAGLYDKSLPLTLTGNMEPRLAEAICTYCTVKGYPVPVCEIQLPKRTPAEKRDNLNGFAKFLEERSSELFKQEAKGLAKSIVATKKGEAITHTTSAEVPRLK